MPRVDRSGNLGSSVSASETATPEALSSCFSTHSLSKPVRKICSNCSAPSLMNASRRRFNPRPGVTSRAIGGGDAGAVANEAFQSAPRSDLQGDSGHANRHDRQVLRHAVRERRHSLRASLNSNVKEPRQTFAPTASRGNRETLGFRPALGVRESIITRSAARSHHDAPSAHGSVVEKVESQRVFSRVGLSEETVS